MWSLVLVLMILSWDKPADAICPQDGIQSKTRDEKDREDEQPVNGLHWDAGEGAKVVCIQQHPVSCSIKPYKGLSEN